MWKPHVAPIPKSVGRDTHPSPGLTPIQWRRHTRACQGKCPGRNTSSLAVKSGNNSKIIYQDILTALAYATKDLPMPCHEQRTGASTAPMATCANFYA